MVYDILACCNNISIDKSTVPELLKLKNYNSGHFSKIHFIYVTITHLFFKY